MTEEQVMAGAEALSLAIWSKKLSELQSADRPRAIAWVRAVLKAAEGAVPAPPPVADADRIWRHLVDVSSS